MVSSSLPTTKVRLRFNIPREEIHFGPDGLMCPFEMTTLNLSALGEYREVALFVDCPLTRG